MNLSQKLRMVHRCWRLRFKSEVPSIHYVRTAALSGKTVLDIGANKGVFSLYMSRAVGPEGKLIAFEAQPELGEHLDNVKQGFGLDNMTIVNYGLSSSAGVRSMHRKEAGSGGASFHWAGAEDTQEIDIEVIRLDDYVDENSVGAVSFIKCDVEGHELDVFRGAEQLLRRDMPTLLFEWHDKDVERGDLFGYLADLGYDGYFFYVSRADHSSFFHKGRGNYVPAEQRASYPHIATSVQHRNYLFVKKGERP